MTTNPFGDEILQRIAAAQFVMLRYETEFTPCTGITAVTKQERRHFGKGVMVSPWCSRLKRENPEHDPLKNGKVRDTGLNFKVNGITCNVLATSDEFALIIFLDVQGRFLGYETPYDTPAESTGSDSLATLKMDSLYFGLAVERLLTEAGAPRQQFIWGADWETVPALSLLRDRYLVSLTLHNTFDECLENQAPTFNNRYAAFCAPQERDGSRKPAKTALQVGLEIADVVTTVNRGFADGMRTETLQQEVMAKHLQHLLGRVVGINNASFATLSPELAGLSKQLTNDFKTGQNALSAIKTEAVRKLTERLPERVKTSGAYKAIVVSMGRRVSQKMHDVLVESLRELLSKDRDFPVLAIFATVHGDSNSPSILARIRALEAEFPSNVVCEDGQLAYYKELMAAADFNCMPSLYEPHGGAYDGTVIPIARAVDGLAEQIYGRNPSGAAGVINRRWHTEGEQPTGFLFRESPTLSQSPAEQFDSLLKGSPFSSVFQAMRDGLAAVLREAVDVRLNHDDEYARLVLAALKKQEGLSWQANLDGMLRLMEQARVKRQVA